MSVELLEYFVSNNDLFELDYAVLPPHIIRLRCSLESAGM